MTATDILRRARRTAGRLARVAAVLAVLLAAATLAMLRAAKAQAGQSMIDAGRALAGYAEWVEPGRRAVVINGQPLAFSVATVDLDLDDVLDRYELWCRGGAGPFSAVLDDLEPVSGPALPEPWQAYALREQRDVDGAVGCFRTRGADRSDAAHRAQVERFAASQHTADLGTFHYAYAARTDGGTVVVTVQSERGVDLAAMFPPDGDVPGADVPDLPRPPTGRRVLSAGEAGHPDSVTIYAGGDDSIAGLRAHYERAFADHGWTVLADEVTGLHDRAFVVERGHRMVVIAYGLDPDGASYAAIAEPSALPETPFARREDAAPSRRFP